MAVAVGLLGVHVGQMRAGVGVVVLVGHGVGVVVGVGVWVGVGVRLGVGVTVGVGDGVGVIDGVNVGVDVGTTRIDTSLAIACTVLMAADGSKLLKARYNHGPTINPSTMLTTITVPNKTGLSQS